MRKNSNNYSGFYGRIPQMFEDDATHELSESRVLVVLIVFYCMVAMYGKDIPMGWASLATALYFGNKAASTVIKTSEIKSDTAEKLKRVPTDDDVQ